MMAAPQRRAVNLLLVDDSKQDSTLFRRLLAERLKGVQVGRRRSAY